MIPYLIPTLLFTIACNSGVIQPNSINNDTILPNVAAIDPGSGFEFLNETEASFGKWLRDIPVKSSKTVYLFNGKKKSYQGAQFAVLDISVGKKDLQQCADAVIRLRTEYLYEQKRYDEIRFWTTSGQEINFSKWLAGQRFKFSGNTLKAIQGSARESDRNNLDSYLEFVFIYAGTLSLQKQLKKVTDFSTIQPGDVLIQGGSPGHAMIVMNAAINKSGRKQYLLAQSYMPAQDIHIVKNPKKTNSPWFDVSGTNEIQTPEWNFTKTDLYRW